MGVLCSLHGRAACLLLGYLNFKWVSDVSLQDYKSTQRVCAEREAASLPRQPARKPGTGRGEAAAGHNPHH